MTAGELLRLLDSYAGPAPHVQECDMTLAELRARFLFTMNRNDPDIVDHVDEFINAGVRYVERRFLGAEPLYARWQSTESLDGGVGTMPLPGCWRPSAELRVFSLPERTRLTKIHPTWLREAFLENGVTIDLRDTSQWGTPRYYAVLGRSIQVRPIPAIPVDLEVVGTGFADPLTMPDDESVVTQEAGDAVLWAACRDAWLTLGDEPQLMYFQTQADQAIAAWIGDRIHLEQTEPLIMSVPG